jgi:hypothetical protein
MLIGWLQAKILAAEERIFLSTLYIGRTEDELVNYLPHSLLSQLCFVRIVLTMYVVDYHSSASPEKESQVEG